MADMNINGQSRTPQMELDSLWVSLSTLDGSVKLYNGAVLDYNGDLGSWLRRGFLFKFFCPSLVYCRSSVQCVDRLAFRVTSNAGDALDIVRRLDGRVDAEVQARLDMLENGLVACAIVCLSNAKHAGSAITLVRVAQVFSTI